MIWKAFRQKMRKGRVNFTRNRGTRQRISFWRKKPCSKMA